MKIHKLAIIFLSLNFALISHASSKLSVSECETLFMKCTASIPTDLNDEEQIYKFISETEQCLADHQVVERCNHSDLVSSFIEIVDTPSL